jgi:hypothetical protein
MRLGLVSRPLAVEEVLVRRLFPARIELPQRWQSYYRRDIPTRRLPRHATHRLKLAF